MIRDLAIKKGEELAPAGALVELGALADQIAASQVFQDYRERKSAHTIRRQDAGLALFAQYLESKGVQVGELAHDPESWRGVSWGLVAGFLRWQIAQGYALGSVNVRLSTIKTYAKLAFKAGVLEAGAYALIRAVEGYSRKESKRLDEQRTEAAIPTRKGYKKAEAVHLSPDQAQALKDQPESPQGRRDRLIMALLLDQGLRVGELAGLDVSDIDLKRGELRFYRPKVDRTQTHRLTPDAWAAARNYLELDNLAEAGELLRGSVKGGDLRGKMSARAITKRVAYLGKKIGVEGLSAHDCRHFWATQAARSGTPIERLKDAGGWASLAMPDRYIQASVIANQGVLLDG